MRSFGRGTLVLWVLWAAGCMGADDDPGTSTVGMRGDPVIGGQPTAEGDFPIVGALLSDSFGQPQFFCTGTLIAPDVVLTAAHCLEPGEYFQGLPSFTLATDTTQLGPEDVVAAKSVHQHPMYDGQFGALGREYDVGIVLLAQPLTGAPLARLPSPAQAAAGLVTGATLAIVGYGQTEPQPGSMTGGVKYDAFTALGRVGPYEIQVGSAGQPQNCFGDSGGPAFALIENEPMIVGVVSRGLTDSETCDQGGIDTRVDAYLDFIHGLADIPCGSGLSPPCSGPPTPPPPPGDGPPGEGGGSGGGDGSGGGGGDGSGDGGGQAGGGEDVPGAPLVGGCQMAASAADHPGGAGLLAPFVLLFGLGLARRMRRRRARTAST
jgi:hypothetical protein